MIRIYSYYSCGGYKDMYVGECTADSSPTYFLPLLPIMKNKTNPDVVKINQLESLPRIELLTKDNYHGLPEEAITMISHGAYELMYRTFDHGEVCVSIRDLKGNERDEEGRAIPFLLLVIADGNDVKRLDTFVTEYLTNEKRGKIRERLGTLFSYDYVINGIKFDMPEAYQIIATNESDIEAYTFGHQSNHVDVLLISDIGQEKIALKEHNIDRQNVDLIITSSELENLPIPKTKEKPQPHINFEEKKDNTSESTIDTVKSPSKDNSQLSEMTYHSDTISQKESGNNQVSRTEDCNDQSGDLIPGSEKDVIKDSITRHGTCPEPSICWLNRNRKNIIFFGIGIVVGTAIGLIVGKFIY